MLDSHALVVGQDGADTDALKVRVMGLDLAQEVVEVFCLVMRVIRRRGRITRAVYSPLVVWLAPNARSVQRQAHGRRDDMHGIVADCLVHVRVDFVCVSALTYLCPQAALAWPAPRFHGPEAHSGIG